MERENLNSSPQETICRPVRFGLQTEDGGRNEENLQNVNPALKQISQSSSKVFQVSMKRAVLGEYSVFRSWSPLLQPGSMISAVVGCSLRAEYIYIYIITD